MTGEEATQTLGSINDECGTVLWYRIGPITHDMEFRAVFWVYTVLCSASHTQTGRQLCVYLIDSLHQRIIRV
jgi:hypothetical protein